MTPRHATAKVLAALLGTVALASPMGAQSAGRGFLFREPAASLSVRGGFERAIAGSDIFSFSAEQFTLGRGDFSGPTVAADLGVRITPRLRLVLGGAYSGTEARSEYRDWVDNEDRPIEQSTTFQRVPVTAGVKAYLASPGRSLGRFAWIPARYAPFVGAGAGAMWYRFRQVGDFINTETLVVSGDDLDSAGWAPTAHAFAGVDLSLSPRFALTTQATYAWGEAELDEEVFEGFEPIDLSGLSATIGFQVRL